MKKNYIKKGICVILAALMAFTIVGCNDNKNSENQEANNLESKKYVFKSEVYDFGIEAGENDYLGVSGMEYKNDKLYFVVNHDNYDDSYTSKKLLVEMNVDGSNKIVHELALPSQNNVNTLETEENDTLDSVEEYVTYAQMKLGIDNTIVCIESKDISDYSNPDMPVYQNESSLLCLDFDGKELWRVPFKQYLGENVEFYVQNFLIDAEGNSYIFSQENCIVVDKTGANVEVISLGTSNRGSAFVNAEGKIQVINWNEEYTTQNIGIFNAKTGMVEEQVELPMVLNNYNIVACDSIGFDLILTNGQGVYGFRLGDENVTTIMSYINSDLLIDSIYNLVFISEDQFVASYWDATSGKDVVSLFTKVAPEDVPEKTGIVLGCIYLDHDIKNKVIEFNKENDQYRIIIKDYASYDTAEDWNAGLTKLNNDILSGNTPDILILNDNMPVESYVSKGVLADFNEFFEKDEELKKENYLQNVLDIYTMEGTLYEVVPSFYVETCVAKEKWIGSKEVWSIEEMQQIIGQMPEGATSFGKFYSRESMLDLAMRYSFTQFVDWETGKCNFDSAEFKELLSFIKTFPKEEDIEMDDNYYLNEYETQWIKDQTLLYPTSIFSVKDFHMQNTAYVDKNYTMIGFPSAPNKGNMVWCPYGFGISEKSNCKDGAWEFVRIFLTDDYQKNIPYGLSINEGILRDKAMNATKKSTYTDEEGNEVEYDDTLWISGQEVIIEPATEEQVNKIIDFIKSVDQKISYNQSVMNIINEEVAGFFEGQKSVDEVAQIIQSRIGIYVKENR